MAHGWWLNIVSGTQKVLGDAQSNGLVHSIGDAWNLLVTFNKWIP